MRFPRYKDTLKKAKSRPAELMTAIEEDVPALAITHALMTRFRSRQDDSFGAKVLAALRHEFGGHGIKTAGTDVAEKH